MRLPMIIDALEKGHPQRAGHRRRRGLGRDNHRHDHAHRIGTQIRQPDHPDGPVHGRSGQPKLDVLHLLPVDGTTLFFILCYTAFACFILGMGLPTTAQYIVAAVIAAPAMLKFGSSSAAVAHVRVFLRHPRPTLLPPVALAAFAGAGIAGSEPFKTGVIATSLSSAKFVVPFVWIYSPIMLLMPWLLTPGLRSTGGDGSKSSSSPLPA